MPNTPNHTSGDQIRIRGAREHNLKNIHLDIPRNKLVILTGLSGSGKSSLAFDTIYAEGQRRYVESLSSYARMFLGQMQKPDVDLIEGLSPAVSIDQKTTSHNPRSTVGTSTEIYDFLRLLFARAGTAHCPRCGKEIRAMSVDQMTDHAVADVLGQRILVLAPLLRERKGSHKKCFEELLQKGYRRVRVDGELLSLEEIPELEKNRKHDIDVVVDRILLREEKRARLAEALEAAMEISDGTAIVSVQEEDESGRPHFRDQLYSRKNACPDCNISLGELTPQLFSFNGPQGACPTCTGLGSFELIDEEAVLQCPEKSLLDGAIAANGFHFEEENSWARAFADALALYYGFDLHTPFCELEPRFRKMILYGNEERIPVDTSRCIYKKDKAYKARFEGVIPALQRRFHESKNREIYAEYLSVKECRSCHGARLRPESLAVTVAGKNIDELCRLSLGELYRFLEVIRNALSSFRKKIAEKILEEIEGRLRFLLDVGLDYLSLARASSSLSGGEAQRIRLATQIGSGLVGVLYILDEPSIGLHQRDNQRLIRTLKKLRDLGNSVLVVEHDEETMNEADFIVDMGPLAGEHGGRVVACGSFDEICRHPDSVTGKFLSGRERIRLPEKRRIPDGRFIEIFGACEHNLQKIDVRIPCSLLTCVTGVSGSGKSSLVNGILLDYMQRKLLRRPLHLHSCREIRGDEYFDRVIAIDQSPIGRTPRSNPATYTGVFSLIRDLFASTKQAKARGYKAGRFSFNVKGGRCEACGGDGVKRIEMHFLPDVYVECDVCRGKRYNRETLEVRWKDKSIADVLDMTVEQARDFFASVPSVSDKLQTLLDVGLGYIKLGQPSTQLSGGEAQRVKLATELSKRSTGRCLYILDEPTTGLHSADVKKLIQILQRLVDKGNTAVVIEHNLDLIKCADYVIDLGPEGGSQGGRLVAAGSVEEVACIKESYTGRYLASVLAREALLDEAEQRRRDEAERTSEEKEEEFETGRQGIPY